ncbi:RNA polymerase-binding protein DksA [candidate division KSB3 bacterium]|uniref:RNA polymerase-binding protein DksA n=1 Tax=candidate division KSB3 bacterium TaxID=2044937 RepID=A0A9D5JZS9_9BACT|nr:RNA polymerase-binding protein DksA [candidate division KSB3 bacterium]MBD3327302.1 RNA polymerase-binding protein DksA [candidate division KSB3 bacterium]
MEERFEKVRQMLIEQKRDILQKIRSKKEDLTNQGGDFIDIATDSLEHELNYIFEEREREKLQNIDNALKRIKEGNYGECEDCGEDIDVERLLALPFTRLCLDCKSKQERQKKLKVYVKQQES